MEAKGSAKRFPQAIMPYEWRMSSLINLGAWLVALTSIFCFIYLIVHYAWVGWPWEHKRVVLQVFSPNVRTLSEDWKFWLLLPAYVVGGSIAAAWSAIAKRKGWTRW